MAPNRRVHDRAILDALEAIGPAPFEGDVSRIARKGRDPLRGSSVHGRWSPSGESEVLYTSMERDGALAEIGFRLSLEPVWPSRLEHEIHEIAAQSPRTLHIADLAGLASLGVETTRYESFDYHATQAIAAAHFLDFDGLKVPSARAPCSNLVFFTDRVADGRGLSLRRSQAVDWDDWRRSRRPGR